MNVAKQPTVTIMPEYHATAMCDCAGWVNKASDEAGIAFAEVMPSSDAEVEYDFEVTAINTLQHHHMNAYMHAHQYTPCCMCMHTCMDAHKDAHMDGCTSGCMHLHCTRAHKHKCTCPCWACVRICIACTHMHMHRMDCDTESNLLSCPRHVSHGQHIST